jgi:hypothetical protein
MHRYLFLASDIEKMRGRIHEDGPEIGHWRTHASVLGIGKGVWPLQLETNMGNGKPLVQTRSMWDGKILYVVYTQVDSTLTLKVIADD